MFSGIFFGIASFFGVLRDHPVFEFVGAHRLRMGDITEKFIREMRSLASGTSLKDIESKEGGSQINSNAGDSIELAKI